MSLKLKLKTRSSAAKRYRKTCQGKFIRKRAFLGHILEKKSSKRKRNLKKLVVITNSDKNAIKLMLPNH
jgi:large subunit ribosomal protein L35